MSLVHPSDPTCRRAGPSLDNPWQTTALVIYIMYIYIYITYIIYILYIYYIYILHTIYIYYIYHIYIYIVLVWQPVPTNPLKTSVPWDHRAIFKNKLQTRYNRVHLACWEARCWCIAQTSGPNFCSSCYFSSCLKPIVLKAMKWMNIYFYIIPISIMDKPREHLCLHVLPVQLILMCASILHRKVVHCQLRGL